MMKKISYFDTQDSSPFSVVNSFKLTCAGILIVIGATFNEAYAQSPITKGTEYKVNATTTGDQVLPAVAIDNLGNYVVVWSNQQSSGSYISAQRYNAAGVAQGSEFFVNNTAGVSVCYDPAIAMNDNGDFVVVWDYYGNPQGIHGMRFNAAGVAQGSEFEIATIVNFDANPVVAIDASGNFVVSWGDASYIYARKYNSSGVAQGAPFKIDGTSLDIQTNPSIAMNSSGNYVIAYESKFSGSPYTIRFRKYTSAGVGGSIIGANASSSSHSRHPSVGLDDTDNFVIAWENFDLLDVSAARFNTTGNLQGSQFTVNTYTTSVQGNPSVAMDNIGNFIVSWESNGQDGDNYGVYSKVYNSSGVAWGSEFKTNTYNVNAQMTPSAGIDNQGDFIVVWGSTAQDGDNGGIYGQQYESGNTSPSISNQTFSIAENSAIATLVGTVIASDADAGQSLTYTITAGNSANMFSINSTTGKITVAASLNYESTSSYILTIQVADNGSFPKKASATVSINVTNVYEVPTLSNRNFSVAENTVAGASVGSMIAFVDAAQSLTYSITAGNTGSAFQINATTGAITVAGSLDYENTSSYSLTVQVTDNHIPANNASATISIQITDVNEADPVVSDGEYSIAENAIAGTVVTTVVASDADAGQTLIYSIISGNIGGAFGINTNTGVINLVGALNYGSVSSYVLTVQVRDNGSPVRSGLGTITINVTDVNEAPTIFSPLMATVFENSSIGILVRKITATDPDVGQTLTYTITSGNTGDAFAINSTTGEITVAGSLDYESIDEYSLWVQITDNGTPALSTTTNIALFIWDANDAPVVSNQSFSLVENSTVGTSVGTVLASAQDGPTLSYAITAGNTNNAFQINSSTGKITVAGVLNHATVSLYNLIVQVTNNQVGNGRPAISSQANVEITVSMLTGSISSLSNTNDVKVYPNPAKEKITIDLENNTPIKIMNLSGQLVREEMLENKKIDVGSLNPGIYILEIAIEDYIVTKKIIIE